MFRVPRAACRVLMAHPHVDHMAEYSKLAVHSYSKNEIDRPAWIREHGMTEIDFTQTQYTGELPR